MSDQVQTDRNPLTPGHARRDTTKTPPPLPPPELPFVPLIPRSDFALAILLVALMDIFIYQSSGGIGYATLFVLTTVILVLRRARDCSRMTQMILPAIGLLAVSAAWYASSMTLLMAFALFFVFVSAQAKLTLHIAELCASCCRSLFRSIGGWCGMAKTALRLPFKDATRPNQWIPYLIPLLVSVSFILLFQAANPVVNEWASSVWSKLGNILTNLHEYIPSITHILFWLAALSVALTYLSPWESVEQFSGALASDAEEYVASFDEIGHKTAVNTLVALNVLFVAYNIVDIRYLWIKQSIPEGLSLSEYAKDGTFWLTIALVMTSCVLAYIFRLGRKSNGHDALLKKLAWIWLAQNFFIALSTYMRLGVYMDYNGLTFLRFLGAFGITAVALGLIVVIYKIKHRKSLVWMIRRQLWVMMICVFALYILPTEVIEKSYNTRVLLNSDSHTIHPVAYQILGQRLTDQGLPGLIPLLDSENAIVSEGVAALLTRERGRLRQWEENNTVWMNYQFSTLRAIRAIDANQDKIDSVLNGADVSATINRLRDATHP